MEAMSLRKRTKGCRIPRQKREGSTLWVRRAGVAESAAGGAEGGVSDQVSRSAVEVWGFLTGTLLSIALRFASLLFFTSDKER